MTKVKKANELSDLDVLEVSLVKRGANKKTFALYKAEEKNTMKDLTAAILAAPGDENTELMKDMVVKGLSKEARSTVGDAVKLLSAVKEEMSAGLYKQIQNALGLKGLEEEKAEDEPREDTPPEPPTGDMEAEEGAEDVELPLGEEPEKKEEEEEEAKKAVTKNDDPRLQELFKANQELIAKIEKHEADKREKAFIEKAQAEFSMIPGATAEEVGKLLRDVDSMDVAIAKKVENILKSTEAFARNSGLFEEVGSSQAAVSSEGANAGAQLNSLAKQRVAKTGDSYAVAYEQVLNENSNLYNDLVGIKA